MHEEIARLDETANSQPETTSGLSRRGLLRAAASGGALALGGVVLSTQLQETAEARGALGGDKGGRRGNDNKGRHKKRSHGDKKDNGKNKNDAPRGGDPLFRSTALTVTNKTSQPLQCTFFFRTKTGLDDYGVPIANGTQTIQPNQSARYDSDHYRVGALLSKVLGPNDLYADVRNVSFFFPRGGVTQGNNLDPHNSNVGTALIPEQNFGQGEEHQEQNVVLKRLADDSKGAKRIEWELTIY